MDDREALQRAVAESPDDDLPRLVLADWWEDRGEPDYATFIRAQVELARTPEWEPFAVRCRHFRRDDWVLGTPFWKFLPAVDGHGLEWHPDLAFRRGLAWGLIVRDMTTFLEMAPRLFEIAPIGQLHLPTATLDQWRRFARAKWLPRVQSIHFYGTRTPIEPVRELCESEQATGLGEMVFQTAGSPSVPLLLADLLRSPLGQRLRSLELRVGPDSVIAADELYFSLAQASSGIRLGRMALVTLSAGDQGLCELYRSALFEHMNRLELVHVPGACLPTGPNEFAKLVSLTAIDCGLIRRDLDRLFHRIYLPSQLQLRALDLSENRLGEWPRGSSGVHTPPPGLRSFRVRRSGLTDRAVEELTRMWFWPGLVELDLRDNVVSNRGALALLDAPRARDLTALLLGGNSITPHMADRLRGHFGESALFDSESQAT